MRNACPTCQTVYAVTPADVGRKIACTRCHATLVIDDDGFRLLDAGDKGKSAAGSKPAPPPAERKRPPKTGKADDETETAPPDNGEDEDSTVDSDDVASARRKSKARSDREPEPDPSPTPAALARRYVDVPTGVFAVGVVLVLWFLFMPIIGTAKHKWYTARIEDEQLAHDKEVKRLTENGKGDAVPKLVEEWRKRKEKLEQDVQWVQIHNRQSEYWDRSGMLGGFILTAVGAVGLLMTHQHTVKKVVGAVVVCAMLVLVFVSFAWKG
jgi:hypothetical protein